MIAKTTWIAVLTSAAIIGGIIGAGSLGITRAEKTEAQPQALLTAAVQTKTTPEPLRYWGCFMENCSAS